MTAAFDTAVGVALERMGPAALDSIADQLESGRSWSTVAAMHSEFAAEVNGLLTAADSARRAMLETCAYLRGAAAGYRRRGDAVRVETVWSGPNSHRVPVRATAQVLVEVIGQATRELQLTTYSAKPYEPVIAALSAAVGRGVDVTVVVETLLGAGSALSGAEPAAAFGAVPGLQLWHWPKARRLEPGAKMHAKVAVADRRLMLISSANLTQSGIGKNMEAGILVRGGSAPARVAEHIAELKIAGELERLQRGV